MYDHFLANILEHKRRTNEEKKNFYDSIRNRLDGTEYNRYSLFKKVISKAGQVNLIAEVKKGSPSKGLIREDFDPLVIAGSYVEHGAAAISVLTEDKFFFGKPMYLKKIADRYDAAILMKDFILDDGQIFEARFLGASAILLIVRILSDDLLTRFIKCASDLDLDCLVEVHNEEEVDRALKCGAEIIGINNRDLETFEVNFDNCKDLIPRIPKDKIIVAESGIDSNEQINQLKEYGANAVLIGETFMRSRNIGAKIKEVMNGES